MRRLELINAANNVINAVRESRVIDFVYRGGPKREEKLSIVDALNSYQTLQRHYNTFSDAEKQILAKFKCENIVNNNVWASILNPETNSTNDEIREIRTGLLYIESFLEKFIDLLKQSHVSYVTTENLVRTVSEISEDREILTLILPESDKEVSKPERLIGAIESINLFYKTIAEVENFNPNDISIVAIDSGSDKSFDFLGFANVVSAVKELIIELWDRVVFFKERKIEQQIDLISKALPLYERINALEEAQTLTPEQSELFRRNVENGVSSFIKVGAIIPEMEKHSNFNPRQIMSPERKLLGFPEGEKNEIKNEIPVKVQNESVTNEIHDLTKEFSPEQIKLLGKLFNKENSKIKKKAPPKKSPAKKSIPKNTKDE